MLAPAAITLEPDSALGLAPGDGPSPLPVAARLRVRLPGGVPVQFRAGIDAMLAARGLAFRGADAEEAARGVGQDPAEDHGGAAGAEFLGGFTEDGTPVEKVGGV